MNLKVTEKVYIADVGPLKDESLYRSIYEAVPEYRRQKTDRYVFDKDRRLSLGAGILLEKALADNGIDSSGLTFCKSEYEKPFFEELEDFHYNLSHSNERVMCLVSSYECGCDVEAVRSADIELAERFFSPCEYEYLKNTADVQRRDEEFIRLWTMKESYIKAAGTSIANELSSFSVVSENGCLIDRIEDCSFFEYNLNDGYRYSVCLMDEGLSLRPELETVNLDRLIL